MRAMHPTDNESDPIWQELGALPIRGKFVPERFEAAPPEGSTSNWYLFNLGTMVHAGIKTTLPFCIMVVNATQGAFNTF